MCSIFAALIFSVTEGELALLSPTAADKVEVEEEGEDRGEELETEQA